MFFYIFLINDRKNIKKNLVHAIIFIIIVQSLLFLWQWRNYKHFHEFNFSNIKNATIKSEGLYKSFSRNQDLVSKGLPPMPYYLNVGSRCLLSLMTRPASFKYFNSNILKKTGKALSYPWIAFWLVGLVAGLSRPGKEPCYYFFLIVIFYFSAATILGAMWGADARFRVPMMPYIAILSAYGWLRIIKIWKNNQDW